MGGSSPRLCSGTIVDNESVFEASYSINNSGLGSEILLDYPQSGFESTRIRLGADDRLTITTESATAQYERVARFPLTQKTLTNIRNDIVTSGLEKSVAMILHYEQTGELPITKAATTAKDAAMKAHSKNDLMQIALAVHDYHDANNEFPAARKDKRDDEETKLYCWRVASPPYIAKAEL